MSLMGKDSTSAKSAAVPATLIQPGLPLAVCWVKGQPVTQGNLVASPRGKLHERASAKLASWRRNVAWTAALAREGCTAGPVKVQLRFLVRRARNGKQLDCDKLARAILDALTGVLYHDDEQVMTLEVERVTLGTPEVSAALQRWTAELRAAEPRALRDPWGDPVLQVDAEPGCAILVWSA